MQYITIVHKTELTLGKESKLTACVKLRILPSFSHPVSPSTPAPNNYPLPTESLGRGWSDVTWNSQNKMPWGDLAKCPLTVKACI